jgi:transposase
MKAYSIDLRKKIVESVRIGVSKSETARRFDVNRSTVQRYIKQLDEEGSTSGEVFEAYVEHFLAPTLRAGRVVVMDNLSAHKGDRVRELIEERSCELIYLPPYSPDFNPIEEAFSKIKRFLREVRARTREALVEAIGRVLDAVSARDAEGFFEHCGYRTLTK